MGLLGLGRLARALSTTVRIGAQYARSGGGYFNAEEWESNYPQVLDDATYKYGNPGQQTILNEYWLPAAENFCEDYENYDDGFNKDEFVMHIENEIGEDKYLAVSEITDEASVELEQAYAEAGGRTSSYALNYTLSTAIMAALLADTKVTARNLDSASVYGTTITTTSSYLTRITKSTVTRTTTTKVDPFTGKVLEQTAIMTGPAYTTTSYAKGGLQTVRRVSNRSGKTVVFTRNYREWYYNGRYGG